MSTHPIVPWLTPPRRAWIYRVCGALVPLLAAVGAFADRLAPVILSLVAALLSTSVAAAHTPTTDPGVPVGEGG